jgi:ribosomal-protein-alanine N-acetyltransferase
VKLRRVAHEDRNEFVSLAHISTSVHRLWITTPTTPDAFDRYLRRFDGVTSIGHVVRLTRADTLVGFVNLNGIGEHGAMIGFGTFAPAMGKGYMREGLELALRFAFTDLRLPRVEADVQPSNIASARLLKAAGFTLRAGVSTQIHVGGAWRLHERWSISREAFFDADAQSRTES